MNIPQSVLLKDYFATYQYRYCIFNTGIAGAVGPGIPLAPQVLPRPHALDPLGPQLPGNTPLRPPGPDEGIWETDSQQSRLDPNRTSGLFGIGRGPRLF